MALTDEDKAWIAELLDRAPRASVAAVMADIDRRLHGLEVTVTSLDSNLSILDADVAQMRTGLGRTDANVEALGAKVDRLGDDVS